MSSPKRRIGETANRRGNSLLLPFFMAAVCLQGCGKGGELKKMLPDEAVGWQASEKVGYYDGERGIFDYMNGGAEVYLAYDFSGLAARKYQRDGLPQVEIGVYDMGASRDAYGIFSFERSASGVDVGQGSEYDRGLLRFWQGKYFYMLSAEEEAPGLKEAMIELGSSFVAGRSDCGRGPELVEMLPPQGLDELSVRYFRGAFGLKHHYFLGHEDVLRLGKDSEVVLASYKRGKGKMRLLLVRYPDESTGAEVADGFPGNLDEKLIEGKLGMACRYKKGLPFAAVFEVEKPETAHKLLADLLGPIGPEAGEMLTKVATEIIEPELAEMLTKCATEMKDEKR